MPVRDALFSDVPKIAALLGAAHARSRYFGTSVDVDVKETKALLVRSIQRHGGATAGATLVMVAETDGEVRGVIVGVLDRILGIGTKLYATDLFFVCAENVDPRDPAALLEAFERWALPNPLVYEAMCGCNDAIGDPERVGKLYERRGWTRAGAIYRKEGT